MGLMREFKEFAMRGNVMDLAIGVIIGAAFGSIVNSLVTDVLMPPIGMAAGNLDFSQLALTLKSPNPDGTGGVFVRYGKFINAVINFLIVAFCVFMIVKALNTLKKKEAATPPPPAPPTKSELLLAEIRDSLRSGRA